MKNTIILLAALAAMSANAAVPNIERNSSAADRWADSVYSALTPRQRVGQLVVAGVMPDGEHAAASVRRLVGKDGCGGLIFGRGSLEGTADATRLAEKLSDVPPLITLDGEWGLSMRIADTPRFPNNMALGAISDYRLLYDYGNEVARQCRLMGIDVNFAPVADVNTNPKNPVIGWRSFGEDPDRVAKAAVAYSLGLEDGGVQAVAKHFPGHGDTETDSHKALPLINHTRQQLTSCDFVPFRSFVDAGCSGIMVGHLSVPALDPSGTAASMSRPITEGVLRGELGFEGLVYTDGLGMQGAKVDGQSQAVAALKAGADVLLYPSDANATINSVCRALENGSIDEKLIADRCKRVLKYKYLLHSNDTISLNNARLKAEINSPQAKALVKKLAAASVTVIRNNGNILPIGGLAGKKIAVVNIGAKKDNDFMRTCRHYADVSEHFTMGEPFSAATLRKINDADVVIAAAYNDNAACRSAMAQLAKTSRPLVGVFVMDPYKMQKFAASVAEMDAVVLAYEDIPEERVSAAEALFGGIKVDGRLPVSLEGIAPAGTGYNLPKTRLGFTSPVAESMAPWLPDSIDALVNEGLRTGAFPGCQVLVARNGNIVFDKAYGKLTAHGTPTDMRTVYDLASVSKALGTLPGIMKAYDTGKIRLDEKIGRLIPEIADSAKKEITVRELLYHESGMPPALNMFNVMFDTLTYTGKLTTRRPDARHRIKVQKNVYGNNTAKLRKDITSRVRTDEFPVEAAKGIFTGQAAYDTIMRRIYDIPLRKNKEYTYSCLNFCLLMNIEQRLTGKAHDCYVHDEIFAPLGAYRTGYRPTEWSELHGIAPTEHDTFLRRQTLRGYVHDETANFSGGVQGNAGLFANADDVAKICQMLLFGGKYGDARVLSKKTVDLFTKSKSPTCRRGLGFDKPDMDNPDYSPTCEEAGASVFGHLGFTGTVFWVDPEEQLIFVFLTNRVNPTRDNAAFNSLSIRPRLYSLVCRSLTR